MTITPEILAELERLHPDAISGDINAGWSLGVLTRNHLPALIAAARELRSWKLRALDAEELNAVNTSGCDQALAMMDATSEVCRGLTAELLATRRALRLAQARAMRAQVRMWENEASWYEERTRYDKVDRCHRAQSLCEFWATYFERMAADGE